MPLHSGEARGTRPTLMYVIRIVTAALLVTQLTACGVTLADLNSHPTKHYQSDVTVTGEVSRIQVVGDEVLLEIADARDKRMLIRAKSPVDVKPTDWIKATGIFVPEAKIGQQTIYDAILADDISPTKPPMLRNLF